MLRNYNPVGIFEIMDIQKCRSEFRKFMIYFKGYKMEDQKWLTM